MSRQTEPTTAQRGYDSRWRARRLAWLRRHPLCVMCAASGRVTAATVVDHVVPHRLREALRSGDPADIRKARKLFYDDGNLQSLCAEHHDRDKQRAESGSNQPGCDLSGVPLDPSHHWHTSR